MIETIETYNWNDARLEFENGCIFEIFTHAKTNPWKMFHREDIVLFANIEM
jgi:hypothetical protein